MLKKCVIAALTYTAVESPKTRHPGARGSLLRVRMSCARSIRGCGASEASADQRDTMPPGRKPLSFHMSFFALNIMAFIVSLDVTILAVEDP